MAENKRVAVFFLIIMVIIAAFLMWLMMFQPEPQQAEVVKEIPHERVFTK
ncbi:MAG: hypothetical protein P8P30_03560 [Rickettsiales bacterium]|nr:hypothetical protein [Rickettsiales bacterium]